MTLIMTKMLVMLSGCKDVKRCMDSHINPDSDCDSDPDAESDTDPDPDADSGPYSDSDSITAYWPPVYKMSMVNDKKREKKRRRNASWGIIVRLT